MKFRKIKILAKLFFFKIKPWFLIIVFHLQTDTIWPVYELVFFQFKTISILNRYLHIKIAQFEKKTMAFFHQLFITLDQRRQKEAGDGHETEHQYLTQVWGMLMNPTVKVYYVAVLFSMLAYLAEGLLLMSPAPPYSILYVNCELLA